MRFFKSAQYTTKRDEFVNLPEEILLSIFFYLAASDLIRLSGTNRKFNQSSNNDAVWKPKLISQFNINLNNKCKEIYKLMSLCEKYKNFFVEKESFLNQFKSLAYNIPSLVVQSFHVQHINIQNGPLNQLFRLFPPLSNYLRKNTMALSSVNSTDIQYLNQEVLERIFSDFKDILNILSQTEQTILQEEKIKQTTKLTKNFMKLFLKLFASEQSKLLIEQELFSSEQSTLLIEQGEFRQSNYYDKTISTLTNIVRCIKEQKRYLIYYSSYTTPAIVLAYLIALPSSWGISGKLIMSAINYFFLMNILDTFHHIRHLKSAKHQIFDKYLENKNIKELNELCNEVFSSTPKLG